jgi:hypothetical protein
VTVSASTPTRGQCSFDSLCTRTHVLTKLMQLLLLLLLLLAGTDG